MKNKKVLFSIILIFCFIICSPMIRMHMSSDTYNLIDLGYLEYPSHYFLRDARIVSAIFTYIAGFLHLSYPAFIISLEVIAILISAISIFVFYNMIIEKTGETNQIKNIVTLIGVTLIIFSYTAIEYFLFAESGVMCLSVLLTILSAKVFLGNKKHRNLKTFILLVLALYCYQGSVNLFIPLVLLLLFIDKNKYDKKYILKKMGIAFVLYISSSIINVATIYIINLLMGNMQGRIGGVGTKSLDETVLLFKFLFDRIFITNFNLIPKFTIEIFIIVCMLIITFSQKDKNKIWEYLSLVLTCILICIAPIFIMKKPGIDPRQVMAIGSIVGLSIIFLNNIISYNSKVCKYTIVSISIGLLILNSINILYIFSAHIYTNKVDQAMGETIKRRIEEYEKESKNIVTKVAYCNDKNTRDYPYGLSNHLYTFTQRAFDNVYCIIEALNYYCNRKFEKTRMPIEIFEDNFKGKDWDTYSDEQIVFKDDTMYLCKY